MAGPGTDILRSVNYKFLNFSTFSYFLKLFNYFVSTSALHNKGGGESDVKTRPFLWPVMQLE